MNTNYIYFQKSLKSVREFISALEPDKLQLNVYGCYLEEPVKPHLKEYGSAENAFRSLVSIKNNMALKIEHEQNQSKYIERLKQYKAAIGRARKMTSESAANDPNFLIECLGCSPINNDEMTSSIRSGHISVAEKQLFEMLKERVSDQWNIYHQVKTHESLYPTDIVAASKQYRIYAIELDGPHHRLCKQRKHDNIRDNLLLERGINIIRIGYDKFSTGCMQTVQEILLILDGQVNPNFTVRPRAYGNFDDTYDAFDSKRDSFYRKQTNREAIPRVAKPPVIPKCHCFMYCQSTGVSEERVWV
jgi:very-short-patch-repair endonuclease